MSDEKESAAGSLSFGSALTILFIALKLTGYISWSWLWVLAPIWIPIALMCVALFVAFIVICVKELIS